MVRRAALESKRGRSRFQRRASGSWPLKAEASSLARPHTSPAVAVPKEMCVASSQWWAMGATGTSAPEARCMNTGGPTAGSPGQPA